MSPIRRWFLSLRPYSFSASLVPVALAAVVSVYSESDITWWTFPFFAAAALLIHAGTNVLNDYYDYRHGVDGPDDQDPSHTIIRGIVTPRFMMVTGHLYFLLALILGAAITTLRGPVFYVAGVAGTAGGYFYTNRRFSLKYRGYGDLAVFVLMGPALVAMGEWALTGSITWLSPLLSLPPAFLVTAILHGNNLRDLETDRQAGVRTLAGALGKRGSERFFFALVAGAYIAAGVLVAVDYAPPHGLIVLLSAPLARRILGGVTDAGESGSGESGAGYLRMLPVRAAALHLLFSLLFIAGLLLGLIQGFVVG